jgi:hypothetical protein
VLFLHPHDDCRPVADQSPQLDRHQHRHRPVGINRLERQRPLAAYFKRATTEEDEEPDPDLRVLEVMKAN